MHGTISRWDGCRHPRNWLHQNSRSARERSFRLALRLFLAPQAYWVESNTPQKLIESSRLIGPTVTSRNRGLLMNGLRGPFEMGLSWPLQSTLDVSRMPRAATCRLVTINDLIRLVTGRWRESLVVLKHRVRRMLSWRDEGRGSPDPLTCCARRADQRSAGVTGGCRRCLTCEPNKSN
jgi:hypothetical protein